MLIQTAESVLWWVISTDRRNTHFEPLRWRLVLQGLARALVELARYGAQLCLGMKRQCLSADTAPATCWYIRLIRIAKVREERRNRRRRRSPARGGDDRPVPCRDPR